MARHRNIRTMNYDEEYDGYDDVYGHSVEDEFASSPSVQHFLYDRSQGHNMSAYIQSDIPEEEEDMQDEEKHTQLEGAPSGPPRIPPLNDLEKAQLYSCLDLLRDRMGDALSEQAAIDAILACNFDAEKALDKLLNSPMPVVVNKLSKPTPREKPSTSSQDIPSIFECDKESLDKLKNVASPSETKGRSMLSQLAFLKVNNAPEIQKLSTSSSTSVAKPKLAELAKSSRTPSSLMRSGVAANRPSLSDLARVNLEPRGATRFDQPAEQSRRKYLPSSDSFNSEALNLAAALRSKCSFKARTHLPFNDALSGESVHFLTLNLSDSTFACKASSFGRVIAKNSVLCDTMFRKFHPFKRAPLLPALSICPFSFTTPSPDDLIKNRLRTT